MRRRASPQGVPLTGSPRGREAGWEKLEDVGGDGGGGGGVTRMFGAAGPQPHGSSGHGGGQ